MSHFPETRLVGGSDLATFAGINSFCRRPYGRDLRGIDAAVLGIPFDLATSYRPGARFGPQAIRRASVMLDHDPHFPFGEDIFRALKVVDWGDVAFDYARPETVRPAIRAAADAVVAAGAFPLALGGDHFVTLPLMEAVAARHGPLALVQFDAHQDTWEDDGVRTDHGTFLPRAIAGKVIDPARSIQVGIRTHAPADCGIAIVDADAVVRLGPEGTVRAIRERVGDGPVYVTFDIDALDPAFAPGTGTPVVGGIATREARAMLTALAGLDVKGADVVEVAPAYDVSDVTALAGASVAIWLLGLCLAARRAKA